MLASVRSQYFICALTMTAMLASLLYLYTSGGILTSDFSYQSRPQCPQIFQGLVEKWQSAHRKCLTDHVTESRGTYWNHLHSAVDKCLGDSVRKMLDIRELSNQDDTKFVILAPNDPQCTEVTLGIGNDIVSEQKLRQLAPNCTFFGADPILASGKIFREVGTYFEIAVGAKDGTEKANVLEGGTYHPKDVRIVSLANFLKNYTKTSRVDYLFMDNEGPEYRLMWQFVRGGLMEREEISICQISIEFHGPFAYYGVDGKAYETLISALIHNSSLLPLWSYPPRNFPHVRAFYVNVEDRYCVEKFLQPRICTN